MLEVKLDREKLRSEYSRAKPVPFIKMDNFLPAEKAMAIARSYPEIDVASQQGRTFTSANERKKVQITDSSLFPPEVAELHELLSSKSFLDDISYITGIPSLLADSQLVGGGIHMTGPGGRLDVHIDFNYIEDRELHRRLNILLYLNPSWQPGWGGDFQLWDASVTNCVETFSPIFNRCVVFETSDVSYHGVVPISALASVPRKSFAAYYYTKEAPAHWKGESHTTIFKARPEEHYSKLIAMPADKLKKTVNTSVRNVKDAVKSIIGRS